MHAHRLFGGKNDEVGLSRDRFDVAAECPGNAIGGIVVGVLVSGAFWLGLVAAVSSFVR